MDKEKAIILHYWHPGKYDDFLSDQDPKIVFKFNRDAFFVYDKALTEKIFLVIDLMRNDKRISPNAALAQFVVCGLIAKAINKNLGKIPLGHNKLRFYHIDEEYVHFKPLCLWLQKDVVVSFVGQGCDTFDKMIEYFCKKYGIDTDPDNSIMVGVSSLTTQNCTF